MSQSWCFWTGMLEKTLESPLDCKEIKPVSPKGCQPWIIYQKDCGWSWSSNTLATWCKESTHWKRPWCQERLKAKGEGVAEDEMVRYHQWLNRHEFEQIPGDSGRLRSLACCSPWRCTESNVTQLSDWTTTNVASLVSLLLLNISAKLFLHKDSKTTSTLL